MSLEERGGACPFSLNSTPLQHTPSLVGAEGCFRGVVGEGLSEEVTPELRAEK